jgi:hemoglobin/transferrin/lactoferrin receptor protein
MNRQMSFRIQQSFDHYGSYKSGSPLPASFTGYFGQGGSGARYVTSDLLRDRTILNTGVTARGRMAEGQVYLNDNHSLRATYFERGAYHFGYPNSTSTIPKSEFNRGSLSYQGNMITPWLTSVRATVYGQQMNRIGISVTDSSLPFNAATAAPVYSYQQSQIQPSTIGYDAQFVALPHARHLLTFGTSYYHDHSSDTTVLVQGSKTLALTAAAAKALVAANTDKFGFTSAFAAANSKPLCPDGNFSDLAAFAQDEYQATRRLRLTGGVRVDRFVARSFTTSNFAVLGGFYDVPELNLPAGQDFRAVDQAVTGSFGAVVRATNWLAFTTTVGHTFHAPGIYERFNASPNHAIIDTTATVTAPNPELKPETGWNVDTGLKLHTRTFRGEAHYFNNTFTNLITSSPVYINNDPAQGQRTILQAPALNPLYVNQRANIGKARIQGLEAEAEQQVELGRHTFTVAGTAAHQIGDNLVTHVPLDPLYFPCLPFKAQAGLRMDERSRKRYFWEYSTRITTRMDRFAPNSSSNFMRRSVMGGYQPGYVVHDLRAGYTLRREHASYALTVGVENLGNRFYIEPLSVTQTPGMGRTLVSSLRVRFF